MRDEKLRGWRAAVSTAAASRRGRWEATDLEGVVAVNTVTDPGGCDGGWLGGREVGTVAVSR